MTLVRMKAWGKLQPVDVKDRLCTKRSCLSIGEDKGTFVQGRGYVSYHEKPRMVCMRRHLHGCPRVSVCPACHLAHVELEEKCGRCGGPLVADQSVGRVSARDSEGEKS